MSNLLQHETSPYLLQHANNPVHWHPWDEAALAKAKAEDKPILVSIGYATCHWCHVMEHESFEDEATAAIMNKHFINIKVDREERPDIDHLYMDALQAMTGSGGWPLNMFLTPNLEPFYGGTYFPPTKMHNRASWSDVLLSVHQAWTTRRSEIEAQGYEMIAHLEKSNAFGTQHVDAVEMGVPELIAAKNSILKNADTEFGGFGNAPKFPQFHSITYLLRHHHFFNDTAALQQATLSLTKMIEGGIYDQLAGGLARYSTDARWIVPHFEKMLYDNALFISALSEAYQLTQNQLYRKTIEQTITFFEQNFKAKNQLYYSAMDADSEGIEGKYYCWQTEELKSILNPAEYELLTLHYHISDEGNFLEPHHNFTGNILTIQNTIAVIAAQLQKTEEAIEKELAAIKEKLLTVRSQRVPPITDTKCLLSWNALHCTALLQASTALQNDTYLQSAENLAASIWQYFFSTENNEIINCYHVFTNEKATVHAFLEDIAYFAQSCLHLYNATGNQIYKDKMQQLLHYADKYFKDANSPFYFFTAATATDIKVRKKEIYDGATPSANAVLAGVNLHQNALFNQGTSEENLTQMLKNLLKPITNHTNSFAVWAAVLQAQIFGVNELKLPNQDAVKYVTGRFIPYKVIKISDLNTNDDSFTLCKHYTCHLPQNNFEEMYALIHNLEQTVALT